MQFLVAVILFYVAFFIGAFAAFKSKRTTMKDFFFWIVYEAYEDEQVCTACNGSGFELGFNHTLSNCPQCHGHGTTIEF